MAEIEQNVIGIIARELRHNPQKIKSDTMLNELGDSLDLIRIVLALEENFNLEIVDDKIEAFSQVGDIIEYIAKCEKKM